MNRRQRCGRRLALEPLEVRRALTASSGDFTQDGAVDRADWLAWQASFGASASSSAPVDGGDLTPLGGSDLLAWQRGFQSEPLAQAVAPADAEAARTALLAGVTQIAVTGSPGRIAVFDPVSAGAGQGAFSVIHDGAYRPIAAAAFAGSGRVVAMGHNGYMNFAQVGDALDTGRFYLNSVAWVADSTAANLRIVTPESGTAAWLQARGFTNVVVRSDWENHLADADVLIAELGRSVSTAKQQAVVNFVQGGGGLITGGTGWGYQQLGADLKTMPGNVVLRNFGLGWADGFRSGTTSATARSTQLGNATAALDFAESFWTTGRGAPNQQREAGEALQAVLGVLPADHPLAQEIAAAFAQRAGNLAATPATPVSNALDKAVLTWESQQVAATPVAQVTAHPTAAALYGAIPADAPRVTQQVSLDTSQPRWQATGLYVPPGEVVTVTVPSSLVGGATRLRIGAHTDDISQRDAWERMPVVHRSFAVGQTTVQVASAFGGLLFVDLGNTPPNRGTVNVTVAGAVEAPYFDLAQHDDAQWNDALRDRPAPYGVLVSESLIIVLPKRQIEQADLTRPTELMTWWNQAVADQDALVGWLQPRTSPEIINVDVQISAGAAHSGFPIQAYERYWGNLADLAELQQNGSWGDFHELGHNHQRGWWTFDGDGEVSVNIFSNYNLETLARDPVGGWAWSADPVRVMQEAIGDVAVGGTYASKSDRWSFWFQLADGFGWDAYRNVFAGYERDQAFNPGALPTSNQQEYDQWFVRWSQEVGYDMKRFMVDTWGMPVSAAAQAAVAALPDWMPLATTLTDFSVPAGGSQTLDLQGGGRSMDGVATLVDVSEPEFGVLVPLGGGQYRYEPTVAGGTDRLVVSYQSSAGNVQAFTLEITIGNGFTPGDVNLDGVLDQADIDAFAAGWRSDTTGLPPEEQIAQGDLDLNGVTDLADWNVLRGAWKFAQGSALDLAVLAEALAAAQAPESTAVAATDEDGALDAALAHWGVA